MFCNNSLCCKQEESSHATVDATVFRFQSGEALIPFYLLLDNQISIDTIVSLLLNTSAFKHATH